MKATWRLLAVVLVVLPGWSMTALADDIDLYSGLSGNANIPNVMIVVDNPSSQNNNVGACTYFDGTSPSMGSTALGNDQCALANIVHGMSTRTDGTALVKIGMTMMCGVLLPLTPVDDNLYSGAPVTVTFNSGNCHAASDQITYTIPAGTTNRNAIIIALKALNQNTGKSGQGSELQETWSYYVGGTGMLSGNVWPGTNATTGCQNDYIIYLSNVKAGASHAQDNGELTYLDAAATNARDIGALSATQFLAVDPSAAGYTGTVPNKPEAGYGIEWARFMRTVDTNNGANGTQNIVTYSVATGQTAVPPAAITNTMEKYISSVAVYGGGKYFPAGTSYSALYNSILKILNEVQAVNSVFASSSLPVSVNAQGTYLNQIYMGMFRPDASGLPRWLGNLKQYQFGYDPSTQTLSLTDSLGNAAISNAGTGFISSNAVSFWTAKNTGAQPDSGGGFWRNKPQGAGGGYDSPDGEIVEKGGAAQVLRNSNLCYNYASPAADPSTLPTCSSPVASARKLYTYCPSGDSCSSDLTDASNAFSLANVPATAFNSTNVSVSSIVRTGTTALVTTSSPHGFTTGTAVTIDGSTPNDYDVTQNVTVNSATTFTITGLGDYPTTPNAGTYTAALHNSVTKAISSASVATSTTANANACASGTIPNINCSRVTVTSTAHGYSNGNTVSILGLLPATYNGTFVIGNATADTFTYDVPVTPTSPSKNAYTAQLPAASSISISKIAKVSGKWRFSASNSFAAGDAVTISGSAGIANGSYTVTAPTATEFQLTSGSPATCNSGCGTVTKTYPLINIAVGNITRASATANTATVTGVTASAFANGNTINLNYASGTNTGEGAYAPLSGSNHVTITCSGTCTSFTFPITTSPSTATVTATAGTVALAGSPVTIPAAALTRSGTTATVTGVANTFTSGQFIDIGVSGAAIGTESAYLSPATGWQITCPVACSTAFTFGPVTLSPATPASGTITASGGTPPDQTAMVNWVRGADNAGDEASPDATLTAINVRGSIHGDVLHSRPAVINYGGTTGVVVYYGSNDGMFRAVNGNQSAAIGSTPAGGELWSFVLPESISGLTRLRDNSPMLLLPSTPSGITPTPQKKQYFADGSTGVYQVVNTDGTTHTAYLYITMRRGGTFMYALDVSSPASPQFLWKISPEGVTDNGGLTESTDFAELGQTWSQPKVASVAGYANPVLIFGAGYDTHEDSEPPGTDTSGRGIFIVDAVNGSLVWSATYGASTGCSSARCTLSAMKYSIPSDITMMDINGDGKIDRLYAADTGGNLWRVDLEPTGGNAPANWKVTQLAALGCATGACAAGTTPRKFFYPPDMVPASSYHAVLIGSGDREHPLYTNGSYSETNRFYMVKDPNTGNDGSGLAAPITEANLKDISPVAPATATSYDDSLKGYYLTLGTGEKVVNGAATVAGYTYFGTNVPATPTSNSCTTNLGTAKGYSISSLGGVSNSVIYNGGGLPPTPVFGKVMVQVGGSSQVVPFCIGCGGSASAPAGTVPSAIGAGKPPITVPTNRTRTYWYINNK